MLTRWNDFGNLARFGRDGGSFDTLDELRRQMNRLFFDFETGYPESAAQTPTWPRVTLEDGGASLLLRAEVPGLSDKDIEIDVTENIVTLKGQRPDSVPEGYTVHRKERSAFRFVRSFTMPSKIDAENVAAELKHGVLTITLPKAKEAQPRQISVRAS